MDNEEILQALFTFGLIILALGVYLVPSFIAVLVRKKKSRVAICTLNILTGWTGLGWLISLIWSLMKINTTGAILKLNSLKR
jgi:hypothetical protein